jgi:hypothetical protein
MLAFRTIVSKQVFIHFNSENTIQRVVFIGEDGNELCVMFNELGIYDPKNPQPIRLQVSCGGTVSHYDEFGDAQFSTAFLIGEYLHALVEPRLEVMVTAFVLNNNYFGVVVTDEEEEAVVEFAQREKRKGVDENGNPFHVWDFKSPIHLLMSGQGA